MILGIDAVNLRGGGGLSYLVGLLGAADPAAQGFSSVVVWAGKATLDRIADRRWLVKQSHPWMDGSLLQRAAWQMTRLSSAAAHAGCQVLFVPGGTYAGTFSPVVTISQNLLPFDWPEARRYGLSWMTLKFLILRVTQARTFRRADGLVFASAYARDAVLRAMGPVRPARIALIPHGVDPRFIRAPRPVEDLSRYSKDRPFRLLYVSIIDVYKHHSAVVEAVVRLRASGLPIVLELIGTAYAPALKALQHTLARVDPGGECVTYHGHVSFEELPAEYAAADAFVYASTCENMPIIVLEAMAAGLPVASSNCGPMPEMFGDAALYFDPEDSGSIAHALEALVTSSELRATLAARASRRAEGFSWTACADQTFGFLATVANG